MNRKSRVSLNRKSNRKKSRVSLNRKSNRKKSRVSLNRKTDGSKTPPIPITPLPSKIIKLENYIEDIILFKNKSFIYTISSFKIFKTIEEKNDTFDFIKELFNFHRENDINQIFHNKFTILGLIIISGLYDDFEKLIESVSSEIIDCNKRKSPYYKNQHTKNTYEKKKENILKKNKTDESKILNKLKILDDPEKIIGDLNINIEYFSKIITSESKYKKNLINYISVPSLSKIEIDKEIEKEIEKEIKKFIYYSVCIDSDIRKYIMRHYLLYFIKSEEFNEYKDRILYICCKERNNKLIINKFLTNIGNYRKLPYIMNYTFTKKNGKKYTFSTCGETTLLNLLNFYFINERGEFSVEKGKFHENLETFYHKYGTMKKQLEDIKSTTQEWLEVVSNLEKSKEEQEEVRLYNQSGDIHNNLKNIIFILKKILKYNDDEYYHGDGTLGKILGKISSEINIEIISEDENNIEFLLDGELRVFFHPGHGDLDFKDYNYNYKIKKIKKKTDDFSIVYNKFYKNINWKQDFTFEFTKNILYVLIDHDLIKLKIIKSHLKKITSLNLAQRRLYNYLDKNELPDSIGELSSLTYLDLDENKLTTLPDSIGKLSSLKKLDLIDNELTTLPDSIGKLSSLTELDLSYNELTRLPDSIGKLSSLEQLYLGDSKLTTLPDSIGKLSSLTELYLYHNELKTLPDTIGELSSLTDLKLNKNKLTILPYSIGKLSSLEKLSLYRNELKTLPDTIGELSSLKELELSYNELTTLPYSIGKLSSLEKLNLDKNKLTILPDSIGELSRLKELSLYHNELTTLPDSIGKLSSLVVLNLNKNKLTILPDSIGKLSRLKKLSLNDNY